MSLYERVADLSLRIDDTGRERTARETSNGTERVTTTFVLSGPDATGRGEDVTYATADHDALDTDFPDLVGEWTLDSFSDALAGRDLFPSQPPEREDFRHYRRWALESAALDLALRQADTSLAAALDREPSPVRFVASTRLPDGDTDRVERLLERRPDLEFKLDPTSDWPAATFDALRETNAVRILDLKGYYEGTGVDQDPDPTLYERVFDVPGAVVEDPAVVDDTRALVAANRERVSWDAPITGLASVRDRPFEPSWLNVKPSRFGSVESLLDTIEWARANDVSLYGGGQFELDVGRTHVQLLASLFYPDGPNDVAPTVYNDPDVPADPPASPLPAPANARGMGWE
ncbi:hypothetical protein MBEHAL_2577 [Halarchaeum acidiphilum MH1-52-1]|uniref:Enolase n=1 Tax=Halarchaeum acidiphilum MH1-52-1 TaxID=1261545 RepID=U2YYG0_9EURY|nr:hypothetical protein [Halarchaeum acidiphilum]GAD53817.1 hypothetical protein MBEHAL_2577 [Halarchaeum acidiphilum MH1-52-1]